MSAPTTPGWQHLEAPAPADAGKYDSFLTIWGIPLCIVAAPIVGFIVLFGMQIVSSL